MKLIISSCLFVTFISFYTKLNGQIINWDNEQNKIVHFEKQECDDIGNIKVSKLTSNENSSSFIIWVKDSVKTHYHKDHTETLCFLEGEGIFTVGSKKHFVKAGDFISIPPSVVHSFKTISTKPVKVLSMQAPEFLGKDRHFIKP